MSTDVTTTTDITTTDATDATATMPAPAWVTAQVANVPIIDGAGMHFTFGSRISAGHDDDERDEAGLRVNRFFIEHPEQVIGSIQMARHNGHIWQAITAPVGTNIAAALAQKLPTLPALAPRPLRAPAKATARAATQKNAPRVVALMKVYETAKALLRADAAGKPADDLRAELHRVYDAFIAAFGPIHNRANQLALKGRPELYFLRALETDVRIEDGAVRATKTAIFFQPTLRPTPQVEPGRMSADEALVRCLNDRGSVSVPYLAYLTGMPEGEVIAALHGRIFCDPKTSLWETADAYLAGNIRVKLSQAREAASHPGFAPNVAALEAVMPAPLGPDAIKAKIGAPWIPASDVRDFIESILPRFGGGPRWATGEVVYHAPVAKWELRDHNRARFSAEATTEWGTARMDAIEIIEKALNSAPPVVYDLIEVDEKEKRVVNQKETLVAQDRWRKVCERFSVWIWEDAARAERLCASYNTIFNSNRRRDFDGSHLLLPGINRAILSGGDLLPHQKDAVWCALQQKATLLDLCVGSGKTFIGLAWAYEIKRLGLAKKVMITVPNHLVEQWGAEANRLYPDMKVMVMSPEDFTKGRRSEFLTRIATEDFDAVICAHTSYGFIPTLEAAQRFIDREVSKLRVYLELLRENKGDNRVSMKEIERKIQAFETKLAEMNENLNRDSTRAITWDELGIDALFVDEAHEFKNLSVPTNMGSIPGVPKGDSKRALDMRIKTFEILQRGGRVVFATGTPIMNTVAEAFVMQTYLSEELLEQQGIALFDAWARTFAEIVPVFEMTPDGGGFRVNTRLARFVNLTELFALWYQITFSRSREQLGLPTPALMGGKRIGVSIPASLRLKNYVQELVARVNAIKTGQVDPRDDNMLKIVSDGGKAALDTRLVYGMEPLGEDAEFEAEDEDAEDAEDAETTEAEGIALAA